MNHPLTAANIIKRVCLYVKHTVPIDWHTSLNLDSRESPAIGPRRRFS